MNIATDRYYEGKYRENATVAVLAFINSNDFTFESLDSMIQGAANLDEGETFNETEIDLYSNTIDAVADSFISFGASADAVYAALESESDDRIFRLAQHIENSPGFLESDDETIFLNFLEGKNEDFIAEAVEKVVRDGKVVLKKKPKKKRKLSAKQKAALRKARSKAHSGQAKLKRQKSLRKRNSSGL